jgi:hypothetical protein
MSQFMGGSPTSAMPGHNDIGSNFRYFFYCPSNDIFKQSTRQMQSANKRMNMLNTRHALGVAYDINRARMAATRKNH